MYLGIEDFWVFLAYALSLLAALLCVVYGVITWNKGDEPVTTEDISWAREEKREEAES